MGTIGSVWIIPVLTSLFGFSAIFIPFLVAVQNGHVPLIIPFISDCGAYAPESCIFSQLLNMTAFCLIISTYLRHRQIVEYYGNRLRRHDIWWRRTSLSLLIMGIMGAFFITSTASFSITDNLLVHMICASISFLLVTLYIWGQVFLSFILSPSMSSPLLNLLRLLLCLLATISLILHEIACFTNIFQPDGYTIPSIPTPYSPQFIDQDSPYWLRHTIAAGAEWSMVTFYFLFVLSMSLDLRYTYMRAPKVFFNKTLLQPMSIDEYPINENIIHFD